MNEVGTVKEIFNDAVLLTPDERVAFLDRVCGSDLERRARVELLLRAHEHASQFMTEPTYAGATPEALANPSLDAVGTHIGPYKLLEKIGEGGFGTVYMA